MTAESKAEANGQAAAEPEDPVKKAKKVHSSCQSFWLSGADSPVL